jgi:DNA-binding transcriptional regulator YiaG
MEKRELNGSEVRRIRVKLNMTQEEFAVLLGMSGRQAICNVETDLRNAGSLTQIVLRVLDSLPKRKAEELVELMLKHGKET